MDKRGRTDSLFNGLALLSSILCFLFLLGCIQHAWADDDSGTFRARWWNYYDRGLASAEKGDMQKAVADLTKALSMREKDQRMARTYGMHFIDYFPHRERGILYLNMGEAEKAVKELHLSISQEESARATYYLNKAQKARLSAQGGISFAHPVIAIASPLPGAAFRDLSAKVKGVVSGEAYIAKVFVNGESIRFDLAQQEVAFEKDVALNEGEGLIVVAAEDLLGRRTEKRVTVAVDREGPNVNLFDVISEEKDGSKAVRVTGEVSDSTGIRRLSVSDRTIEVGGNKTYEFSVSVARGAASARLVIEALDVLGNETRADIDVEEALSSLNRTPAPVMLAFNGKKIFSVDKEAPVITLREKGDMPPVFVDRYYLEGEVSDNSRVEKIVVNGKEVSSKGGKKIFFNRIVKLNEGENRIVVEAFDSSGNKAGATLTVQRTIPSVLQVGARTSLSLLPFDMKGKESRPGQAAYDELVGFFVDQKRFRVIERMKLEQILLEHKLSKEKLTDPEHSIRVGRLMAADAILATSINEEPKALEVTSRLINTETSEVIGVKDVFTEEKSATAIKELMEGLAAKIASLYPLAEGLVISTDGRIVYTDLTSSMNIKKGMGIIIHRRGKEVRHPVTGKSLGWDTVKVGEGHIEEIHRDFSKVRPLSKGKGDEVKVKDMVITK